MTKTGYTLEHIGRGLSWDALGAFLHKLDLDTETAREIEPDLAQWAGTVKTNAILADIYDMLAAINANLCAVGKGERASKPKRYPRPGDKKTERIGKDALPAEDLRNWFEQKRIHD